MFYKFMKFSDLFSGPLSSLFHKHWVVSCFPCYEALGFVLFHAHWASFHFFFFYYTGSHFRMGFLLFHVFICLLIVQFICFLVSTSTVVSLWIFFCEQNLQYVFLDHYFNGHLWIFFCSFYYMLAPILFSRFFENFKIFWRILMTKSFYLVTGQHLAWKKSKN